MGIVLLAISIVVFGLKRSQALWREQSVRDPLTAVFNRLEYEETLKE